MSRILPTLLATTAVALVAITLPMSPANAAGRFDGTWIIDVQADRIVGDEGNPTCPALRLGVQITDNQISGNFRRSYPEAQNVVENGGSNRASQVTGMVQPDGSLTAQWQNFHAMGKFVGDHAGLVVQSACGPMKATLYRLNRRVIESASVSSGTMQTAASGSSAVAAAHESYNVYFAFDRSKLTGKGQQIVDAAVGATQRDQASRIALVGKADLSGTDPYNMALSQRRADRVRDAMVAGGVPSNRIDVRWVGDREPPVATAAGVREQENRVVEVAVQ